MCDVPSLGLENREWRLGAGDCKPDGMSVEAEEWRLEIGSWTL